jgi:general stress protein YciG
MIKWWKHHLIPRHMGGSDEPSNLVKCNTAMHVFFHKQLHEEHGKIEDYLAYKGLEGQLSKDEIMLTLSKEGGRKGGLSHSKGHLSKVGKLGGKTSVAIQLECPHCGKSGNRPIISRWHFDNCNVKLGGKLCTGCDRRLQSDSFYKNQHRCKECQAKATRQRRSKQ